MNVSIQDALKLYFEEQAAEAQLHSIPPGQSDIIEIPGVALHVKIGGQPVRFDLDGLRFKRAV